MKDPRDGDPTTPTQKEAQRVAPGLMLLLLPAGPSHYFGIKPTTPVAIADRHALGLAHETSLPRLPLEFFLTQHAELRVRGRGISIKLNGRVLGPWRSGKLAKGDRIVLASSDAAGHTFEVLELNLGGDEDAP